MIKSIFSQLAGQFSPWATCVVVIAFTACSVVKAEADRLPKDKEQETKKLSAFAALLPHNNTNECKLRGYRPPFNKPPYNRHKYNQCLKMIERLTTPD